MAYLNKFSPYFALSITKYQYNAAHHYYLLFI